MTALPMHPRLLTAAEYAALPEDIDERHELQEGTRVMSPRPVPAHQYCLGKLIMQMTPRLPDLVLLQEVDVDLALVPSDGPGTVRVPDLVVVTQEASERVDAHGGSLRADDVLLSIEVLSPGSIRMDTRVKHDEYADAGMSHYWIIDLTDGPSLTACHLAGEFGYIDDAPVRGVFRTDAPFELTVDLGKLR